MDYTSSYLSSHGPQTSTTSTLTSSTPSPTPHSPSLHPLPPLPPPLPSSSFSSSSSSSIPLHGQSVNQLLPGAASLLDCLDKRILVILRDGRSLTGILRSYDQFGNLVFQDTTERIHVGNAYSDIERGVFLVRGENVVLLGEMDGQLEDQLGFNSVPIEEILLLQKKEEERRDMYHKIQKKALSGVGLSVEIDKHDFY